MPAATRCDWHVGDLGLPDDTDPLQEIAQLQSEAQVIDLSLTEGDLIAQLDALVDKESRYFKYAKDDDGVRPLHCELKWSRRHTLTNADATLTCFNCPNFVTDRDSARSLICNLGRAQCDVAEQIRGLHLAESLEDELVAVYAADIEQGAELAEVWLAAV